MVMNTVPVPERMKRNHEDYIAFFAPYIPIHATTLCNAENPPGDPMKVKVIDTKRHLEAQYKAVGAAKPKAQAGKVEYVTVPMPAVKEESEKFTTIADEYFK
jgi:hypothetical protein